MTINYAKLYDRCVGTLEDHDNVAYLCLKCGQDHQQPDLLCASCGGAIDAFYDLSKVTIHDRVNPLERYFDLLPIRNQKNLIWTGEGNTPLLEPFELRKELGLPRLYLKDETVNPTSTTKDRMASVGTALLKENGIGEFAISSTGNSSTAYARAVQLGTDMTVHIFVGADWLDRLNYASSERVHTYSLETSFAHAGQCAARFAKHNHIHTEGGFFNLGRREGLKLAYLEAFDQMPETPEYVFQAISSGMGLLGGFKGALEYFRLGRLDKMPRFFAVQQESCSPIVRAFKDGHQTMPPEYVVKDPTGIAKAILRGDSTQAYPYIRGMCEQSQGDMESVSENEIIAARNLLRSHEGIDVCFSTATCLAGMIKLVEGGKVARDSTMLVMLTGRDRPKIPRPVNVRHFSREQVERGDYLTALPVIEHAIA